MGKHLQTEHLKTINGVSLIGPGNLTIDTIPKVPGTKSRFAFLKNDGTLSGDIPLVGVPTKIMGIDANNVPVTSETVEFKSIDTSLDPPTALQLVEKGTDRVDYPNLNRIYFACGNKWVYIEGTEVIN